MICADDAKGLSKSSSRMKTPVTPRGIVWVVINKSLRLSNLRVNVSLNHVYSRSYSYL